MPGPIRYLKIYNHVYETHRRAVYCQLHVGGDPIEPRFSSQIEPQII